MQSWDDALKNAQPAPPAAAPPSGGSWDQAIKPPPPAPAAPKEAPDFFTKYMGLAPASEFDPNWKPTGNAFTDFMNRPLAKNEGIGASVQDAGLSMADYATLGLLGKTLGPDAQQAIAQAHRNMGVADYGAQAIGYGVLPGQAIGRGAVGLTGKLAPGAGRLLGSTIAGGLEGGTAGALGTYGHEAGWTPDAKEIGAGAAIGALTGGLGGAAGGEAMPAKGPTEAQVGAPGRGGAPTGMYAAKEQAYAPLDSIYFKNAHQQPIQDVWNNLIAQRDPLRQGIDLGVSPEVQKVLGNIGSQSVVTGRNLQKASMDLQEIGGPDANRFADALKGTLQNAQPMPGSTFEGAPAQVGQAGAAQVKGDLLHGQIKDLERLGTDPSNIPSGAVKQTQQFPQNAPGAGTPQSQALIDLARAQKPGFNWWTARHIAAPIAGAGAGAAEGYFNAAEGQDPWVNAGIHSGEDMMLFGGLHAAAAPRPANALEGARYSIATGRPATTARGDIGNYLMNLWAGHAAAGQQQP